MADRSHPPRYSASDFFSRIPLWAILIIPFITVIAIIVSLTDYLSYRNSQQVVDDIASQLLDEFNARIETHLRTFLETPIRINKTNATVIRQELLDISDMDEVGRYFWDKVQVYDTVSSIYFGNPKGGLVSGGREGADNSLYIMNTDNFESGPLNKYATDSLGAFTELLVNVPEFDSRMRPWFIGAVEHSDVNWTAPYVLSTGQDMAIASSLPIYDESGELIGVTSVDIFVSHIQSFLASLKIGKTGQAYVVDPSGLLVATSADTPTFAPEGASSWRRIPAIESDAEVIRLSANFIIDELGGFLDFEPQPQQTFEIAGKQHYLSVTPFHNIENLDWLVVIVVPRDDFFEAIDAHYRVTFLLIVLAVVLATSVGTVIALQVSRPIINLSRIASNITEGNWTQRAPVKGVKEIRLLGYAFNEMSAQLHETFTHLEERVRERTAELAASEARYRAVVEDQTELICRFLPDNTLTFVNDAYCRYFDETREALIGSSFMPLIPHEDQLHLEQQLKRLGHVTPVITVEHRTIRADGETRWMQWINRVLFDEDGGEIVEFQAVGRDTTEGKQAEEALQRALERETELNELKSHFISTVSHEFRTPMAIILNSSEIIERYRDRVDKERQTLHFERIRSQINHMVAMLDEILMISRASRKREVKPESFDIIAFCQNIIDEIRASVTTDVSFNLASKGDCTQIITDRKLLRLIVINLISNAEKYSEGGDIITVQLRCNPTQFEITVQDEGIGIPEDAKSQIFEPFYRADNVGKIAGTGLGLAIVRQAVEQQGGTVSFQSEVGKGTTFTAVLPNAV